MLPSGAKIVLTKLRFKPIFASIADARKTVIVEITDATSNVVNDKLESNAIIEYARNGIGMNKINKTAKNTPTAHDAF